MINLAGKLGGGISYLNVVSPRNKKFQKEQISLADLKFENIWEEVFKIVDEIEINPAIYADIKCGSNPDKYI